MASSAYIAALQRFIRELHGCIAEHTGTEHVIECVGDRVIWEGDVEVFTLSNHPRAHACFAWVALGGANRDENRMFALLGSNAIKTAEDAVKYAHVAESSSLIDRFSTPHE